MLIRNPIAVNLVMTRRYDLCFFEPDDADAPYAWAGNPPRLALYVLVAASLARRVVRLHPKYSRLRGRRTRLDAPHLFARDRPFYRQVRIC